MDLRLIWAAFVSMGPRGPAGLDCLALTAPAVRCRFGAGELVEVLLGDSGQDGWRYLRTTERLQIELVTQHADVELLFVKPQCMSSCIEYRLHIWPATIVRTNRVL